MTKTLRYYRAIKKINIIFAGRAPWGTGLVHVVSDDYISCLCGATITSYWNSPEKIKKEDIDFKVSCSNCLRVAKKILPND